MCGTAGHRELVQGEKWREKLTLQHRYVVEDLQVNLALQESVGRWCGTPTPLMHSLLALFAALVGDELTRAGRTLESLGLSSLGRAEVKQVLAEGI